MGYQSWVMGFMMPGLLLLATACRTPAEAPGTPAPETTQNAVEQDPQERDAVLAALETMKQDAFRDAFAGLTRYRYTRYTRTEQYDAARHRTAFTEHVARIDPRDGHRTHTLLQADSAGAFDPGALGRFVTAHPEERDDAALPEYVLLDDPPYLAPRNRDAFLFRFLPDTSFWDAATRVIEVEARPGQGDGQSIRRTRLYLDQASNELVAAYLERSENTLFFDEKSVFYLRLRPAPGGDWAPFTMRVDTRLRLPLRAPRHLRTVSTYYRYEPVR